VSVVKTGDERPWVMVMVTINTGNFESVKVGIADYGEEAEKVPQLASRVSRAVFEHVEEQVHSIKDLHTRLDKQPSFGGGKAPSAPTFSPATAGVPSPSPPSYTSAGPLPAGTIAGAMAKHDATKDLVRRVDLELLDISERRRRKKADLMGHWLRDYSYTSPEQASPDTLTELLAAFDRVNAREG